MRTPRKTMTQDGAGELPEPRPEDEAWAAAMRSRFEGLLAAELFLRRLRTGAEELLQSRRIEGLSGLREFLDLTLPSERSTQDRVAGAIGLHPAMLDDVRRGEISVGDAAPLPLARLGYAMGLTLNAFLLLVEKDLVTLEGADPASVSIARIREAWEEVLGPGAA